MSDCIHTLYSRRFSQLPSRLARIELVAVGQGLLKNTEFPSSCVGTLCESELAASGGGPYEQIAFRAAHGCAHQLQCREIDRALRKVKEAFDAWLALVAM